MGTPSWQDMLTRLIRLVAIGRYATCYNVDEIIILAKTTYVGAGTPCLLRSRIDEAPLLSAVSHGEQHASIKSLQGYTYRADG